MIFHIAFQVLLYAVGILFINKKHNERVNLVLERVKFPRSPAPLYKKWPKFDSMIQEMAQN